MTEEAPSKNIHEQSLIIDAVCPLVMDDARYLAWYREGGVTALAPTVGSTESARRTLDRIAAWCKRLRERSDLMWVRVASDVEMAKVQRKLGIFLHLQGTDPIEDNLDLIDVYKHLGVGIIQLTYNVRNRVGDGCEESSDAGLSRFGRSLVDRLNEARIIVDCSHTGARTTLGAIERSRYPVVLSHSNVSAVHHSARNVSPELIDNIARSGGVIGIAGFPAMISESPAPSLSQFIAHIDAIVEKVGIDHVALGLDYYPWQHGVATREEARRSYEESRSAGIWGEAYPPPPHIYPAGIETPKTLQALTSKLLDRGYSEIDTRKILGLNWLRVMKSVWG